jgi:hypothetical protein
LTLHIIFLADSVDEVLGDSAVFEIYSAESEEELSSVVVFRLTSKVILGCTALA